MRGIDRHQPDTVMVITDSAVETVDPFVIAGVASMWLHDSRYMQENHLKSPRSWLPRFKTARNIEQSFRWLRNYVTLRVKQLLPT